MNYTPTICMRYKEETDLPNGYMHWLNNEANKLINKFRYEYGFNEADMKLAEYLKSTELIIDDSYEKDVLKDRLYTACRAIQILRGEDSTPEVVESTTLKPRC